MEGGSRSVKGVYVNENTVVLDVLQRVLNKSKCKLRCEVQCVVGHWSSAQITGNLNLWRMAIWPILLHIFCSCLRHISFSTASGKAIFQVTLYDTLKSGLYTWSYYPQTAAGTFLIKERTLMTPNVAHCMDSVLIKET